MAGKIDSPIFSSAWRHQPKIRDFFWGHDAHPVGGESTSPSRIWFFRERPGRRCLTRADSGDLLRIGRSGKNKFLNQAQSSSRFGAHQVVRRTRAGDSSGQWFALISTHMENQEIVWMGFFVDLMLKRVASHHDTRRPVFNDSGRRGVYVQA